MCGIAGVKKLIVDSISAQALRRQEALEEKCPDIKTVCVADEIIVGLQFLYSEVSEMEESVCVG